jgi:hypothetical protein
MAKSPDVDEPTREFPPSTDVVPVEDPPPPTTDTPNRVSGFARVLIFIGVVFALMVASCLGLRAVHLLPSFDNPFSDKTTDRSQPVLLQSMRDLHRYVAADGTFQVIVDLQSDKENIPDFLLNDRVLFVGSGTVEEYVDFSNLSTDAMKVDNDKHSITLTLPAPAQSQASLDMQRSYVVAEERGLFNRIGDAFRSDPNKQQKVYALAQQRITEAARSSGLDQRAKDNTEKMLTSLFARLGYTSVSVTFNNP